MTKIASLLRLSSLAFAATLTAACGDGDGKSNKINPYSEDQSEYQRVDAEDAATAPDSVLEPQGIDELGENYDMGRTGKIGPDQAYDMGYEDGYAAGKAWGLAHKPEREERYNAPTEFTGSTGESYRSGYHDGWEEGYDDNYDWKRK